MGVVGGRKGLGGVIITGALTGNALAGMTLQFGQVRYAQLALIVGFVALLKCRSKRNIETVKV